MNDLLGLLILLPAIGGAADLVTALLAGSPGQALSSSPDSAAGRWSQYACTAAFLLSLAFVPSLWGGLTPVAGTLRMDSLGAVIVLLATGLGAVCIGYCRRHLGREALAGRACAADAPLLFGFSGLFVAAAVWTGLTDHLLFLYVALEATTLASALPVAFYRRSDSWDAAYKYLLLNSLGLAAGLLGLVLLYAAATPKLGPEALSLHALATARLSLPPRLAALAGGLIIVGFGTKAGLVPMHGWLPDAYQQAPGGFSALFAGIGTKVALLAMARALPPLVGAAPALQTALVALALLSMLVGIALTFVQEDLRRLLGFSSISQMGYIALGIGVGGTAAYTAAAFHMLSHGLLKALLFLCAAALLERTGSARFSDLGQLEQNRWVKRLFLLGALGLGGIPPLPAFWSKFQLFAAASQGGFGWAAIVAVAVSLLTLTTMIYAYDRAFAGTRGEISPSAPDGWLPGLLTAVILLIGLVPGLITGLLTGAAPLIMVAGG